MSAGKGPRSHRLQHMNGIPRVDRSIPSANSNPTERRMTFAEAVDQPELFCLHTAAANYKQSEPKCITPKRLMNCAEAGLSAAEIAHGFDCSQATVYNKLKKCGIRLKPDSVAQAIQAAEDKIDAKKMAEEVMAELGKDELVVEGEPERVNLLEGVTAEEIATNIKQNNELYLQTGWVRGDGPAPVADEYTMVFGRSEEQLPELNVAKNGNINIRNCELDVTKRYVVCFRPGMQNVRLDNDKLGKEFKPSGNQFSITCKPIAAALIAAGIDLPARYRLDPAAMTGVLL